MFVVGFKLEVWVLLLNCIILLIGFVLGFCVVVICFKLMVVVRGSWFDNGNVVEIGIIWFGRFVLLLLFIMVIIWIGVLLFSVWV